MVDADHHIKIYAKRIIVKYIVTKHQYMPLFIAMYVHELYLNIHYPHTDIVQTFTQKIKSSVMDGCTPSPFTTQQHHTSR